MATGLPLSNPCGAGSSLTGTSTVQLSGGSLSPGETCTFSVTLQEPATAPPGRHTNTTSAVMATVLGVSAVGGAASDDLRIAGLTVTKDFLNDPVLPGATTTLRFTIASSTPGSTATDIAFTDDLDAALAGLVSTSGTLSDICGVGSTSGICFP